MESFDKDKPHNIKFYTLSVKITLILTIEKYNENEINSIPSGT